MRPLKLLALAGLLLASPALADDPDPDLPGPVFRFEYKIMPGVRDCPMEEDARTIFHLHFRYDLFAPDAKTTLSLVARPIPGKLHVDMSARDEAGNVTWKDSYEGRVHCWSLIHSAAFLAWSQFAPPPPECPVCPTTVPPPPPAPAPPPPPPKTPPVAPQPRPISRSRDALPSTTLPSSEALRLQLAGGVAGGYGMPPGVSFGPVLGIGIKLPSLSVGIELDARFAVSGELDQGVFVPTSAFTGKAVACLHRKWFLGCGLVAVGHLLVAADPPITSEDADPNFLGLGIRIAGEYPFTDRLALRAHLDGIFPTATSIAGVYRTNNDKQILWASPFAFSVLSVAAVVTF